MVRRGVAPRVLDDTGADRQAGRPCFAARHYEYTTLGARDEISRRKSDIKKGPEGPFKELAMVGDTGLEPVTSCL